MVDTRRDIAGTQPVIERVPLVRPDLPAFEEVEADFREAFETGRVTNFGKNMRAFEAAVSDRTGAHVAAVSSATVGLLFALQALGLERGQRVILPSFTFTATAQAIEYAGGVPVFAEVEEDLTLSPADVEQLLARIPDVAMVIPVHTYGNPCRVDAIQQIAEDASSRGRPISVLYDAAHALGSSLGGRAVGSFGNAEVFSLSATKLLVSVEGGMVASKDEQFIERIRTMRNYGLENYDAVSPGLNAKMSELHAIVGLHNVRRLPELISARRQLAAYYTGLIREETIFEPVVPPSDAVTTYKDFTVILPPHLKTQRSAIMAALSERGIETRAYFFPAVHEQRYFRRYADRALPVTEDLSRRVITLPFFTKMSRGEVERVVQALREVEKLVGAETAGARASGRVGI